MHIDTGGQAGAAAPQPTRRHPAVTHRSRPARRARSQRAYLAALVADPELAELRADARRSVLEVAAADHARILAEQADRRAERREPSGYAEGAAAARAMLAAKLRERRRPGPGGPESVLVPRAE